MNKLKELWAWVVAALGAVLGVVVFILSRKSKQVDSLNAKIDLAKTDKETDVLEAEINTLRANKDLNAKHSQELDKSLGKLEEKRTQVNDEAKALKNPKEISDYWNNN